ncbi:MAG: thioredoxin domain-containing protein [Rhodospirillales bacterium]|nr:thioredoxin domain-containing protein [Rhodospirillales bacterium]
MSLGVRNLLPRSAWWLVPPVLMVGAIVAWFALDPGFRGSRSDVTTAVTSDAFGQRVRDYLLEHPEVIMEAVGRLEARSRAAEENEAQAALKSRADELFRDPASPVGGNPAGDVTMVEFFDYNCPYCRRVTGPMRETVAGDPQLRVVYKEFPILGPNSIFAAKAALAAHRQGRYVAFHEALMQAKGVADEASALRIAAEIGLDVSRLKADMADAAIQSALDRNLKLAQALRIAGTPGFVIGEQILRGATDAATLRNLVDKARSRPPP